MSDKVQIQFFGSQTSRGVCVFSAGQQVQAQVLLDLAEPMKARSVKIHITGRAEVHWTESESHTSRDMHGKDETRHETIHFRSNAVYMDQQATLWTAPTANQQQIAVGHHRFPFTFNIPAHCPPSFEGTYGHIRYICTAIIDRPWKFDKKAKASFVVSPFVDLNAVEWALTPVTGQKEKDIGILLFKHGKLNVKAHLPKSGFVAGERIPLQVEVDNGTSKEVRKVKAKLVEKVVFIAQRNHTLHYDLCVTNTWGSQSQHFAKRTSSQKVAQLEQPFTVAAHSKGLHQAQLAIPPCVPSFNTCPLIRVDYVLEIKVETNASFGSTAAIEVPLLLGTIPVRVHQWPQQQQQQQPPMAPVYSAEPNAPPPSASGGGLYPSLNEPSAPPMEFASAPPLPSYPYPTGPPPAYEESVLTGVRSVGEDGEQYTPRYPYYKDL